MAGFILALALLVFSGVQWWQRYSLPYNESGRYFDPGSGVVWHEHAVTVYAALTILALLLLAWLVVRVLSFRTGKGADK